MGFSASPRGGTIATHASGSVRSQYHEGSSSTENHVNAPIPMRTKAGTVGDVRAPNLVRRITTAAASDSTAHPTWAKVILVGTTNSSGRPSALTTDPTRSAGRKPAAAAIPRLATASAVPPAIIRMASPRDRCGGPVAKPAIATPAADIDMTSASCQAHGIWNSRVIKTSGAATMTTPIAGSSQRRHRPVVDAASAKATARPLKTPTLIFTSTMAATTAPMSVAEARGKPAR